MTDAIVHPLLLEGPIAKAQRDALFLLLGGGLDATGKMAWISWRISEGMSTQDIFLDALKQMEGQIAT